MSCSSGLCCFHSHFLRHFSHRQTCGKVDSKKRGKLHEKVPATTSFPCFHLATHKFTGRISWLSHLIKHKDDMNLRFESFLPQQNLVLFQRAEFLRRKVGEMEKRRAEICRVDEIRDEILIDFHNSFHSELTRSVDGFPPLAKLQNLLISLANSFDIAHFSAESNPIWKSEKFHLPWIFRRNGIEVAGRSHRFKSNLKRLGKKRPENLQEIIKICYGH